MLSAIANGKLTATFAGRVEILSQARQTYTTVPSQTDASPATHKRTANGSPDVSGIQKPLTCMDTIVPTANQMEESQTYTTVLRQKDAPPATHKRTVNGSPGVGGIRRLQTCTDITVPPVNPQDQKLDTGL